MRPGGGAKLPPSPINKEYSDIGQTSEKCPEPWGPQEAWAAGCDFYPGRNSLKEFSKVLHMKDVQ